MAAVNPKDWARVWWKGRSPKTKKNIKMAGVAGGIMLAVLIGSNLAGTGNSAKEAKQLKEAEKVNQHVFLQNPQAMTPREMQAEIDELQGQLKKVTKAISLENGLNQKELKDFNGHLSQKIISEIKEGKLSPPSSASPAETAQFQQLEAQISALQSQLSERQVQQPAVHQSPWWTATSPQALGGPSAAIAPVSAVPGAPSPAGVPNAPAAPKTTSLAITNKTPTTLKQAVHAVTVKSAKGVFLPAGTILSGVMLTGVQAGTGPQAKANPVVVDIRVKRRAILPNGIRANFSSCDVIASGYGDLSNHRVYFRSNTLSCVERRGGKVITAPIHAEIESGGLLGVPGTVISHQGPVIVKSLIAGIFSGLGQAAQPVGVQGLNLNPANGSAMGFQMPSPGYIGSQALAGGISTPAQEISKFYLHEAEQLMPVIQVNPGVSIDMFLITGAKIDTSGMSPAQLQEAEYQSAEGLNGSTMAQPAPATSPYGPQSPYAGSGQSEAVGAAFPNRETVQREEQAQGNENRGMQ